MKEDLASMEEEEANKQAAFQALMQGKQKQIAALTAAIDQKEERYSAVKVQISEVSHDLTDTKEALASDEKLRAELTKECDERKAAYTATKKDLSDEMIAITETLKILSDDDARDLFAKTVPGPDAPALVQVGATRARRRAVWKTLRQLQTLAVRHPATAAVFRQAAAGVSASGDIPESFAKLTALIDRMVGVLDKEQEDDDLKKQMCTAELRRKEDHKTALHEKIAGKTAELESTMSQKRTAEKDIEVLTQGIAELDAAVGDATKQRKEAHAYFVTVMAESNAAMDVLQKAKDRLEGYYKGKAKEGTSAVHMISMIQEDISKELAESKASEASDQQDYEEFLEASAEKRETDARAITERSAAQAGLDEEAKMLQKKLNMRKEELDLTEKVIENLHQECDWLLEKYEERAKARAAEVEALKKTQATLKGADYSSFVERSKNGPGGSRSHGHLVASEQF